VAEEIQKILEIQRMDSILRELEVEIRSLPKKIEALEKQSGEIHRKREAAEAKLAAQRQELKRLENSVQDHKLKIQKLKKQLMDATTQEQVTAFQHEIDWAEKEISAAQAKETELLEGLDGLEAGVRAALVAEKEALADLERQKAEAAARSEEDRTKGKKIYRDRMLRHGELPQALRDEYDRLRKSHRDGVVAVDCTDGACSGCLMTIRPALLQQIRTDLNKLFRCESCRRFLVYNPPRAVAP
jgi:predicted  nucleic acid-binding Zn-ribbon protein